MKYKVKKIGRNIKNRNSILSTKTDKKEYIGISEQLPTLGKPFIMDCLKTTEVIEVNEKTFKTKNSIYEYEKLSE